ncbi:MAG: LL-diaminopimelate aminotransferase [Eubacteriales bacterium]
MLIRVNENYKNLAESYLFSETGRRVREYAAAHPDKKVIKLSIGDVTRPLAPAVVKAMCKASEEMGDSSTFRGYPPEYGYDFLREKIAAHYEKIGGVKLSSSEIFVSDGAKSDLGNIVDILGDNLVLIPDPVYPVYVDSNVMSGHKIELIPSTPENNFAPTPEYIPDSAKNQPAVIYLCSPNNPTGAVYTYDELGKWVSYAKSTGSLIIFDSAYEAYIHGDLPHTIYEISGADECAVEICSFSKSSGFTGTRCGWTVVPEKLEAGGLKLNKLWARRQATKFNGVSYPVQRAAEAALSDEGLAESMESVEYYMGNAKLIADVLREKGIYFTGGVSSPYIWMKVPDGMDSWGFFDYLLNELQIAGTPGAGFGKYGEGFFRLTSFGTREATVEACERMREKL